MNESICQWCQAPSHAGGCDREALKVVIQQLRAMEAARSKIPGEGVVMIRSLISHRNQKPRIDIQVGEIHTQMDSEHAIQVALNILQTASGAYSDGFIFHFLREKIEIDEQRAVQILQEFRTYREDLMSEFMEDNP